MSEKKMGNKKVEWVEMNEKASKDFIESFMKKAGGKLEEAKRYLKEWQYPQSIYSSQECIEFSTKAIFLMLLNKYPQEHLITKKEYQEIAKRIDEAFKDKKEELQRWMVNLDEFPKLYIYSEFWRKFRDLAKYGDEELGVTAEKLFSENEANLALRHAEKCRELALRLQNYLRHG